MQTLCDHYWYDLNEETGFRWGMGRCVRPPESYPAELAHAARLVYENSPTQINVMMSGGVDSELVARAFHMAGIPFTAHLGFYFLDGKIVNGHDLRHAIIYCLNRDIPYVEHPIHLDDIVATGQAKDIAVRTGIRTFRMIPQVVLMEEIIDQYGHTIMGDGGDLTMKNQDGEWLVGQTELGVWWCDYAKKNHYPVSQLLQYTPEVYAAMLHNPMIYRLAQNQWPLKQGANTTKVHAMRYWFRDMKPRPIYHGFEKCQHLVDRFNQALSDDGFDMGWRSYYIPFWKVMENLHGSVIDLEAQSYYPPYQIVENH